MISTCVKSIGKVLATGVSFVNTLWLKIYLLERKKQQQEDKKNRVLLLLYDKKVIGVISPRLVAESSLLLSAAFLGDHARAFLL